MGLWFACVLLAVFVFSLLLGRAGGFFLVFRITAMLAVPVGCLYLPLVAKLKDAEDGRWLILIGVGALIGPAALAGLGVIATLLGRDPHMVWVGDGVDLGVVAGLPFALIVGALISALYVAGLKIARLVRFSD